MKRTNGLARSNSCRFDALVVRVDYQRGIVYIWDIYTHAEYGKIDFKKIDEKIRREKKSQKRK